MNNKFKKSVTTMIMLKDLNKIAHDRFAWRGRARWHINY